MSGVPFEGRNLRSKADRRTTTARGFTLIELLVVIAIIGVLVALTLPAVFGAHETMRRTQCLNNIRQITTGMLRYEQAIKTFPPNWGSGAGGNGPTTRFVGTTSGLSWLTAILPHIEENALYDWIRLGSGPISGGSATDPTNPKKIITYRTNVAAATLVRLYLCPSDTQPLNGLSNSQILSSTGTILTASNYKSCAGCNWAVNYDKAGAMTTAPGVADPAKGSSNVEWPTGRNNASIGGNSANGFDYGNGVICRGGGRRQGVTTAMADLHDGPERTFAVGEYIQAYTNWSGWFWFDASTATCGVPLNYYKQLMAQGQDPGTAMSQPTAWQWDYSFMSRHPGGANFSFCGGNAQFINDQIDLTIYRSLATIDGTTNIPQSYVSAISKGQKVIELPLYNHVPEY